MEKIALMHSYECKGPILVRIPILPMDAVTALCASGASTAAELLQAVRPLAPAADLDWILFALMTASPSLSKALKRDADKHPDPNLRPILAYLLRMSARATPYGVLAGVTRVEPGA